jgi:hypothetical protein
MGLVAGGRVEIGGGGARGVERWGERLRGREGRLKGI